MTSILDLTRSSSVASFAKVGEPAVFTPASGDPEPCKVFIEFDVDLQPYGLYGQAWDRGTTIDAVISTDAAAAGIAVSRVPEADESFTVYGVVYKVGRILENDRSTVKMVVS